MGGVTILLEIMICMLVLNGYILWEISKMVAEIHGAVFIKRGEKDKGESDEGN